MRRAKLMMIHLWSGRQEVTKCPSKSISWLVFKQDIIINSFIGSVAGVVEHLAMYPVDTIKVSTSLIKKLPYRPTSKHAEVITLPSCKQPKTYIAMRAAYFVSLKEHKQLLQVVYQLTLLISQYMSLCDASWAIGTKHLIS